MTEDIQPFEEYGDFSEVLKDPIKRDIIGYFEEKSEDTTMGLQELAEGLEVRTTVLHHSTLPDLERFGILEYDQELNSVEYDPDSGGEFYETLKAIDEQLIDGDIISF